MAYITPLIIMPLGADTHIHTRVHVTTREPKQFQETRRVRPLALRAWFKNEQMFEHCLAQILTLKLNKDGTV